MNINGPGQIAAAAAASFFKGQELSNEESKDAKDKRRLAKNRYMTEKTREETNKTQQSEKGYLA